MRKTCVIFLLFIAFSFIFPFDVTYFFESSNLIIEVSPSGDYQAYIDKEVYNFKERLVVPWKRGKVDRISIKDMKTEESKNVVIEGVRDDPPKIYLEIPDKIGFGVYPITPVATDDWDEASTLKIKVILDGVIYKDEELNSFILKNGWHKIEALAVDSFSNVGKFEKYFLVKIDFPPKVPYKMKSPNEVIFSTPTNLEFVYPKDLGIVKKARTLRRDKGKILKVIDDYGNRGYPFVISPLPGDLSPLPEKTAITTISGNLLLLESGSPYTIISRIILPKERYLVMGGKSSLNITAGELIVKGTLLNIAPGVKISGGKISVMEGGKLFLEDVQLNSELQINFGEVVYLKNVTGVDDVRVKNTKYLFLKDMKIKNLECRSCGEIFLVNTKAEKVYVDDLRKFEMYSSEASDVSISTFCKSIIYDSTITNLDVLLLSKLYALNLEVKDLNINNASTVFLRESSFTQASVRGFSTFYIIQPKMEGKIRSISSEIIRK